jgi:phage tail sheath protein FI
VTASLADRTIYGAPTAIAAFVSSAAKRTGSRPVRITSIAEFSRTFGPCAPDVPLCAAVESFFLNGGQQAYVTPTESSSADGLMAGLNALREETGFNLLSIPDSAGLAPREAASVSRGAASLCEERRAFYLVDPPRQLEPTELQGLLPDSANAACYYPQLLDTSGCARASSGAVAGLVARVDEQRGVWKPPAGDEAILEGVAAPVRELTRQELELLDGLRINPVRKLPDERVVVWGDRTLSSDSEWKYVNVRRLALFLEESIDRGTQWAVFEPNAEPLWRALRSSVEAFLFDLWRQGAFPGARPEDAFFVRCDRTTMTQADIDAGRLVCLVGFAPVKPAEFVLLRIAKRVSCGS